MRLLAQRGGNLKPRKAGEREDDTQSNGGEGNASRREWRRGNAMASRATLGHDNDSHGGDQQDRDAFEYEDHQCGDRDPAVARTSATAQKRTAQAGQPMEMPPDRARFSRKLALLANIDAE